MAVAFASGCGLADSGIRLMPDEFFVPLFDSLFEGDRAALPHAFRGMFAAFLKATRQTNGVLELPFNLDAARGLRELLGGSLREAKQFIAIGTSPMYAGDRPMFRLEDDGGPKSLVLLSWDRLVVRTDTGTHVIDSKERKRGREREKKARRRERLRLAKLAAGSGDCCQAEEPAPVDVPLAVPPPVPPVSPPLSPLCPPPCPPCPPDLEDKVKREINTHSAGAYACEEQEPGQPEPPTFAPLPASFDALGFDEGECDFLRQDFNCPDLRAQFDVFADRARTKLVTSADWKAEFRQHLRLTKAARDAIRSRQASYGGTGLAKPKPPPPNPYADLMAEAEREFVAARAKVKAANGASR